MDYRTQQPEPTLAELLKRVDDEARKLEEVFSNNENKNRVFLLIFHDLASITRDVVDDVEFYLQNNREMFSNIGSICVVLHTAGGDADAAYHIGVRLQEFAGDKRLIFVVPRFAKSAGTLLTCAGDEIYLTPISELGPIDPQVYIMETGRWISAQAIRDSLRQVLETVKDIRVADSRVISAIVEKLPIIELGHYDSLVSHVKSLAEDLLKRRMFKNDSKRASEIAQKLVRGYSYHGKVIHAKEAQDIGLKVTVLDGETLTVVYSLYRAVKELLENVDRIIEPFISAIRQSNLPIAPTIEGYEISHGLIYVPTIRELS